MAPYDQFTSASIPDLNPFTVNFKMDNIRYQYFYTLEILVVLTLVYIHYM